VIQDLGQKDLPLSPVVVREELRSRSALTGSEFFTLTHSVTALSTTITVWSALVGSWSGVSELLRGHVLVILVWCYVSLELIVGSENISVKPSSGSVGLVVEPGITLDKT